MTEATISRHKQCPRCQRDLSNDQEEHAYCAKCRFPLSILQGKYRLEKELAAGGFGVVYIATAAGQNEPCVVKLIQPEILEKEDLQIRFQREIRLTRQLSERNDNIIRLFDHGVEENLGYYYVMELLEGLSLKERLVEGPPFSIAEGLHVFEQLCVAMDVAHEAGVIHRDLKPDNIFLLDKEDAPLYVKVLDFGIAKPLAGTLHESLTKGAIGTPAYMSPEQIAGKGVIDRRSDVYAMGIVLYELLAGHPPFQGDQTTLLFKQMTEKPKPLHECRPDIRIPEGLERAVMKALEKSPNARFATAGEFWEALLPYASADTIVMNTPVEELLQAAHAPQTEKTALDVPMVDATEPQALYAPPQRSLAPIAAGVTLVLLLIAGGVLWKQRTSINQAPALRQKKLARLAPKRSTPQPKRATKPALRPPDAGSLPQPKPPTKRVTRAAPKPRSKRRRTKPRPSPRARPKRRTAGVCGRAPKGQRWVHGVLATPQGRSARFRFAGCPTCRAVKKAQGYCLTLPMKAASVRIFVNGYRPCKHKVAKGLRKLRWVLEKSSEDSFADEFYKCTQ